VGGQQRLARPNSDTRGNPRRHTWVEREDLQVKTATTFYHYQITISPAYEGRCRHAPARTLGHPDENPALGGTATEITWRPAAGSREEKTERLKPWVAPRRQTFIMIDPAHAGDYGHPSSIRLESPGHHASPVPHPRRGHWRHLAADRKTWVRPAWVGAMEWQHQGRTYKIQPKLVREMQ